MKTPIYINLHIPKTAGYTFRYHITKNLRSDEQLLLDYEFLGLDLFNPPLDYDIYKKAAFKLIKSIPREKREKIKIIHGHAVPFGVHELFDRDPKYFTFVRNPVERTVSIYNHLSYLNSIEGHEKRKYAYYEKYLLVAGNDPGFDVWLTKKYKSDIQYKHFSLSGYLREFGYLRGKISQNSINDSLCKFYFLGLTENFSDESLYFFKKIGMCKYFIDQNISHKKFVIGNKVMKRIVESNKFDKFLYLQATKLNSHFKEANPEFQKAVDAKKIERQVLLPFTQVMFAPRQTLIRIYKSIFFKNPIWGIRKTQ